MPKSTYQDAVSKAVARAVDVYYQSSPGGPKAELVGRAYFRNILIIFGECCGAQ